MAEDLVIDRLDLKWHHFDDPDDPELVVLAAHYSLHELALEDCATRSNRPKVDEYEEYVFVILNTPRYNASQFKLTEEKLSVFIGEDFVISVSNGKSYTVNQVKNMNKAGRAFKSSKDLFYSLIDHACDQFLPTIDAISEDIAEMEIEAYEKPDQSIPKRATALKRILTILRKSAVAHREIINKLLRMHPPFVDSRLNIYFRDVYDHLVQATELIETNRDLLIGIVDINLSITAHRTNEIMKTLTIYATILLPLNVVTGFFGMNFKYLPFLQEPMATPIVALILLSMAAGTAVYIRMHGWRN